MHRYTYVILIENQFPLDPGYTAPLFYKDKPRDVHGNGICFEKHIDTLRDQGQRSATLKQATNTVIAGLLTAKLSLRDNYCYCAAFAHSQSCWTGTLVDYVPIPFLHVSTNNSQSTVL